MLLPETIYKYNEKSRIITQFSSGVAKLIGEPSALWVLDDNERAVCLTSLAVITDIEQLLNGKKKLTNQDVQFVVEGILPSDYNLEPNINTVSISDEEYDILSGLNTALEESWNNILDRDSLVYWLSDNGNWDEWIVVYEKLVEHIKKASAIFEEKGINIARIAPKTKELTPSSS